VNQKTPLFILRVLCLFALFAIVPIAALAADDYHVAVQQKWRHVQEKAKDAVVHVVAHVAEVNILEPYLPPVQKSFNGSGFFISKDGYIVTNAHVVNQAVDIRVLIPSIGQRLIAVQLVSISPDCDLALLKVHEPDLAFLNSQLGTIPTLELGDSDSLRRADEVIALGYPLGQYSLKSTTGVISGIEHDMIQISAPINPGNSGGPLLNLKGEAVGINTAGIDHASGRIIQNMNFIIPINRLKSLLPVMKTIKLIKKPFFGATSIFGTDDLTEYLGNPHPGGLYVADVIKGSLLFNAGIKAGDMIYEIDGHRLDIYGEITAPWGNDKVSVVDYVSRLKIGDAFNLVVYRKGNKISFDITIAQQKGEGVVRLYPGYEDIAYEIFGGMIIEPLALNHMPILLKSAPGLYERFKDSNLCNPALVITRIFNSSELNRTRTLLPGFILKEINGIEVKTLDDFRAAVLQGQKDNLFVIKAINTVDNSTDNVLVVLPLDRAIAQEQYLAQIYGYPVSSLLDQLMATEDVAMQPEGLAAAG